MMVQFNKLISGLKHLPTDFYKNQIFAVTPQVFRRRVFKVESEMIRLKSSGGYGNRFFSDIFDNGVAPRRSI